MGHLGTLTTQIVGIAAVVSRDSLDATGVKDHTTTTDPTYERDGAVGIRAGDGYRSARGTTRPAHDNTHRDRGAGCGRIGGVSSYGNRSTIFHRMARGTQTA